MDQAILDRYIVADILTFYLLGFISNPRSFCSSLVSVHCTTSAFIPVHPAPVPSHWIKKRKKRRGC